MQKTESLCKGKMGGFVAGDLVSQYGDRWIAPYRNILRNVTIR
ncbi:MAG: hypothetical protein WEA56_09850 [Balneolaceae bacterium]